MGRGEGAAPAPAIGTLYRRPAVACIALILVGVSLLPIPRHALLPVSALFAAALAMYLDARVARRAKASAGTRAKPIQVSEKRAYSWEEVAQHNTDESAWIAIDGQVYDVTPFVDAHPGGREMLLLCVGRDATDLFKSYHPFTAKPKAILPKYHIGTLATYEHPLYTPDSGFYAEVCEKVGDFFEQNNLDPKAAGPMFARFVPVYVTMALVYLLVFTNMILPHSFPFAARACLAVFFGMLQGLPLTGWMHDCSHASLGHTETSWWIVGRMALDLVSGSSMLAWRNQHVIGHHVYTNVFGSDPDLPTLVEGDPRRLVPEQVWLKIYQYQHIYMPVLYGILSLKSRVSDINEVFGRETNGPIRVNPICAQDALYQFASKSFWFWYRLVIPTVVLQIPLTVTIPLFLLSEFTTGYWLAFNFQVSHVTDEADFFVNERLADRHTTLPEEWAKSQVKGTIDYGHGNVIATYLSGALNYQTVHHLLPTVSQAHYPKITPLVMEICDKHGVKYNALPNFTTAFACHINHLRELGRAGIPAELKVE